MKKCNPIYTSKKTTVLSLSYTITTIESKDACKYAEVIRINTKSDVLVWVIESHTCNHIEFLIKIKSMWSLSACQELC